MLNQVAKHHWRKTKQLISLLILTGLLITACQQAGPGSLSGQSNASPRIAFVDGSRLPGQYIVVLRKDYVAQTGEGEAALHATLEELLSLHHIPDSNVLRTYSRVIAGAAMRLSKLQLQGLRTDRRVDWVEEDRLIFLNIGSSLIEKPIVQHADQETGSHALAVSGTPVRHWTHQAWIIDSGIDVTDPSLKIDPTYAANFTDDATITDRLGHGTYIARLIAAQSVGHEQAGIAPGAPVVPVKVLDHSGSGRYSDVIAGLDHVAHYARQADIVQLSLSGPPSNALDEAVRELATGGCRVILAAAGADQHSPSRVNHERVLTVAANDLKAPGADTPIEGSVDRTASGYSTGSTFPGGSYPNGHSVAAAYVSGSLLLEGDSIN